MKLAPALKNYLRKAMELHQAGAVADAMKMYRDVLAQDPGQADALHLLGAAEWQHGNLEEAERLMRKAIAIWDKGSSYFCDLAGVLRSKGDYVDAVVNYKKALKLDPRNDTARFGMAETYGKQGYDFSKEYRWEEAEASYLKLLEIQPQDAGALNNLAEIYQHGGDREKALATYNRALAAKPDYHLVRYNRAICNLCLGRLREGWEDLGNSIPGWMAVIEKRDNLAWKNTPLWNGGDLNGKKVLLWGDQGIGDEIIFASMVPELIDLGAKLTIECTDRLIPLFERSFPGVRVVARHAQSQLGNEFDFLAPGVWLGRFLRPDSISFPARTSYLKADKQKTAALRAHYTGMGKKKIIGLAWHSSSMGRASHRRMSLMEMAKALPKDDVLYIDLQYGDRAAEIEDVKRTLPDFDFFHDDRVDQMKDMDAFAAQIAACDNVVTIGNTTAHLAGALGIPAQVLLPIAGLTWYWFENRPDSPWYPSLSLLRKVKEGDWSVPLARLS